MQLKNRYYEERPWGCFDRFTLNEQTTVKLLYVKPNQALSLQYHNNRDEFCRVVKGRAKIILGDEERLVKEGDEYWVPRTMVHRTMTENEEFGWLEIWFGNSSEDDIVRLEDNYGRAQPQ